jgi:hypothetical protein
MITSRGAQPERHCVSFCRPQTATPTGKILGIKRGEGKLNEVPENPAMTCLFVRNPPKSLAKITIARKICQHG